MVLLGEKVILVIFLDDLRAKRSWEMAVVLLRLRHNTKVMRMAETRRVTAIRIRFCIGNKVRQEFVEGGLRFEELAFLRDGIIGHEKLCVKNVRRVCQFVNKYYFCSPF